MTSSSTVQYFLLKRSLVINISIKYDETNKALSDIFIKFANEVNF